MGLAEVFERYRRGLSKPPNARDLRNVALLLPVFALITGALGFATGLLHLTAPPPGSALVVPISLLVPALAEETLFRGYLPNWRETHRPFVWLAASTVVFLVWHIVQPLAIKGFAPYFWRADFLLISGTLGTICGMLRMRSGSLWPGVIFHWIVVAGWLTFLGGPGPVDLL
jgi:predicted Abi (CAAX) family protease